MTSPRIKTWLHPDTPEYITEMDKAFSQTVGGTTSQPEQDKEII